jgi:carboxymethylenebutenolidase
MTRHQAPLRIRFTRNLFPFASVALAWALIAGNPISVAGSAEPPAPPATAALATEPEVIESKSSYESQGKTIVVERFEPKAPGAWPAVLVLHGAGGMSIGGPAFRDFARLLARRGYVAHVVHYFDLTGTKLADLPTMKASFPGWLKAVADGVSNVSKQPNVDPKRVGLLGFSLGAYVSLSVAMFDHRIGAVVEYFGGLPEVLVKDVKSLPPTLILHGDADRVVPVSEARALEKLFKEKDLPHEVRIYAGQGHGFTGDDASDATRRALAFFEQHVKQAPTRRHEVARPNFDAYLPSARPEARPETSTGGGKD